MQMRKEVRTLRCIKQLLAEKNSLLTGKDRRIVVQDELKRLGVGELERVPNRKISCVTFENAIEFEKMGLLQLINKTLRQRYAYVF